jgi:probable rRNA maturation factor
MKIYIQNLQDAIKLDKQKILKCAAHVLNAMNERDAELSLVFVNDTYIRRLNWKYRNADSKTDVLAFPMREGKGLPKNNPLLGDVVISVETAKKEAKKRHRDFQDELDLYLIHGILHLLGYDDEKRAAKKRMREKERELIKGHAATKVI